MPGPPKKKAKQQSLTSFFTQTDKSSAHLEDPDTSEIAAVTTSVQEKDNIQSESDESHVSQKSDTSMEFPFQPSDYKFPLRSFSNGKKSKAFQGQWFKNEDWKSWLHYDPEKDAAFCATCIDATRRHLLSNSKADAAFTSNGFVNWIDAGTKNRGFDKHRKSESHLEAEQRLHTIPASSDPIYGQLVFKHSQDQAISRQNLLKIISNVRFLARQALPSRGHGSGQDSNFTQLYVLREEDNPGLRTWRTEKKTDKYVHSTMQNEMMQVMALKILRHIAGNIRDADFFTMMCDEATDVTNTSQLVVCIRWVDENLNANDEFIGLKDMPCTDAKSIVFELKDVLLRMHLNLKQCRGQCYDGCSTMSGSKNGVAKMIKNTERRALYTHCYAHSLNLAVGDTMNACPILKDTIDTTYELTKLVKMSPKRDAKLKSLQEEQQNSEPDDLDEWIKDPSIKLFCHTRWTVRRECLRSVIANFDTLQKLWDWSLKNSTVSELKARVLGVKVHSKTFSYIFGIHLAETILCHTDNLSKTLQGTQITAVDAQQVAMSTVQTLAKIRSEEDFHLFWAKINKFMNDHGTDKPKLPRKTKPTPKCNVGTSCGDSPATPEDDFRQKYYSVLDTIIACIKDRFLQDDYDMYLTLEQLVLKSANGEQCEEEFQKVTGFYDDDFDCQLLEVQLKTVPSILSTVTGEKLETFHDVRKAVQKLRTPVMGLISQFIKVVKLIIVMPATNAVSERSFSAMRRLLTYLRSSMSKNRLNNSMVLHIHKEHLDTMSLIDIANDFVKDSDHRMHVFGQFHQSDMRTCLPALTKSIGIQVDMNKTS